MLLLPKNTNQWHGGLCIIKLTIFFESQIPSILSKESFFFDSASNNLLLRKGQKRLSQALISAFLKFLDTQMTPCLSIFYFILFKLFSREKWDYKKVLFLAANIIQKQKLLQFLQKEIRKQSAIYITLNITPTFIPQNLQILRSYMNIEKDPQFANQISQRNSNVRFTFGPNHFDKDSPQQFDPKKNFGNFFAEVNRKQAHLASNMNEPLSQEFSGQIMVHLLELESKWIQKETQIKEYVENLKKTVEEKDIKIEKILIENYKLSSQLTQIGKQKNQIFEKLNQIHCTMISLQNEKLQNDSDRKFLEKSHRSQQNEMIAQILKLAKLKDSKDLHQLLPPQSKLFERNTQREDSQTETKSMEKRILSNLIKLFEENFNLNSAFGSDESSQNNGEYVFSRKGRQVRATMATNDTYGSNPRGSFIDKGVNFPIDSEKLNPSSETKKQPKCYKSARTITFSKEQEADDQNQGEKERFYSHNVIQFNPKIFSEGNASEQKESERSNSRKQQAKMEKNKRVSKESESNSLRIQSRALNQSYKSSEFSKQKKRSKEKKKTTNLDYSLSSSLVSESQTNEIQYEMRDQEEKQSFKPLTHETIEEKKTQIGLSKLSATDFNMKRSKTSESDSSLKQVVQKTPIDHSRATNQLSQQESQNHCPLDEPKANFKLKQLQVSGQKSNEASKLSNPEAYPPLKKTSLLIDNAFTFQNTPQNHSIILQNTAKKLCENTSKKSLTIERQNSITFDHTNQKKSSFQPNQIDSFETQVKNHQNRQEETNLPISNEKTHLFVPKIGPETKCSTFEDKSYGNSFYFNKTSSSDDPFKKLKIQSQNSQNQQRNKQSKLNFENQMLKSYNKVLEIQTKKMTQTEKLMEKFNSQNASILNKIHKKSIS